jgi:hypothetical protein
MFGVRGWLFDIHPDSHQAANHQPAPEPQQIFRFTACPADSVECAVNCAILTFDRGRLAHVAEGAAAVRGMVLPACAWLAARRTLERAPDRTCG